MLAKVRMQRSFDAQLIIWVLTSIAITYIVTLNYIIEFGL